MAARKTSKTAKTSKAKTPKTTKAKTGGTPPSYPVPFLGEGDAGYFEWAGLTLVFSRPVKSEEKRRIGALVPMPLAEHVGWSESNRILDAGNDDQFIHLHIQSAYPTGKERARGKSKLKTFRATKTEEASSKQLDHFEDETRAFVREAHAIVPLTIALRDEDFEGGGTSFGPWHAWSEKNVGAALDSIAALVAKKPSGALRSVVTSIDALLPKKHPAKKTIATLLAKTAKFARDIDADDRDYDE